MAIKFSLFCFKQTLVEVATTQEPRTEEAIKSLYSKNYTSHLNNPNWRDVKIRVWYIHVL